VDFSNSDDLETCACPLCSEAANEVVYRRFKPFEVVRCKKCRFLYVSPRLTERGIHQYYANPGYFEGGEAGYDSYSEQEPALRATFRRLLAEMKKRRLTGGDLLEVGCGYGFFLSEAKSYFVSRVGTDFSAGALKFARKEADEVVLGGAERIPEGRVFDVIVATQVIEHVYDPRAFVLKLKENLRPGGSLVLTTPDEGSFWHKLMKERWPSLKLPEHVLFFDYSSLSGLMRECGLTAVHEIPCPHAFPASLVGQKLGLKVPHFLGRLNFWFPKTTVAAYGTRS
jgi:SAM-dependent methyltransferase